MNLNVEEAKEELKKNQKHWLDQMKEEKERTSFQQKLDEAMAEQRVILEKIFTGNQPRSSNQELKFVNLPLFGE